MTNIHVNSFVERQSPESRFTHFTGDWGQLKNLVEHYFLNLGSWRPGYRDGVILVDVDPGLFRCGLVTLKPGDQLVGRFEARKEGETPRKSTSVVGASKSQAESAFVVLYSSKVLAEDGENELPAVDDNYEIISLNSSPTKEPSPIHPSTLCHNHFGSDGGTATNMSDRAFVKQLKESFEYWNDKAFVEGE